MCDCVLLRKPGGTCSYVSHHYKSQCSQVYNYHRLLSWDKGRGLHMDIYKVDIPVSRILHHIHPCLIYEAIMRHIRDEYEAIKKQISIIFSKNEVVGAAIFVYCQTTIKL